MGRLEISIRCMEIRSLLDAGELEQAYEMAENLDIERVTSIVDLKVIASVYERMGKYEDAMEILYRSYEKKPTKMVVYRLAYLCVKTKKFDDAEFFYQEFTEMAPDSPDKYILRYGIDRAKGVDYYVRIATLQQLKSVDYREEWGYELAKVYHKAGLYDDCIRECDDLILWFGEGVIVEKAKLLKKYHIEGKSSLDAYGVFEKNLTPEQMEYNREKFRFDTQDLGRQIRELAETEMEEQLRGDLKRDLEKTVDLRKAMIEDSEALDLLGREVHRSWGTVAPAQGSEVIQIKKLRSKNDTKNEQRGFWKNKKNTPDMEEIFVEEESNMDVEPAEEDWEIRESVAIQPKFHAASLQEELAKEIARIDEEYKEQNELIDDYEHIPIYEFGDNGEIVPHGESEYREQPKYEIKSIQEEPIYSEKQGYEEEPEYEELVDEEESEYEELVDEEEPEYEELVDEEEPECEELVDEEEPEYEELVDEEEPECEELVDEEEPECEEPADEEKRVEDRTEYKEKINKEEQGLGKVTSKKEETVEEKFQEQREEETQEEIPAYVQRDRNSAKHNISLRIGDRTENLSEEQKTLRIFRRLLGRNEKNNQKEEKDTNIHAAEEIKEHSNARSEREHTLQEGARVNVVKVKPAITKDKKQQRKAKLHFQNENVEEGKAATGVVKRYMGKGTSEASVETKTTDTHEQNLQQAVPENPDILPEEKKVSSVNMNDVWKLFPQYQESEQVCEGILSLLQSIFDGNGARNFIVTSKSSDNAHVLCVNMADILCEYGVIENKQPVILSAEELNKMHLEQNYDQVRGSMLQITGARKITPDTAQSIMNMLNELRNNVIVVLNDGKPYMDDFMNEYKIMQKYFPHWIIL